PFVDESCRVYVPDCSVITLAEHTPTTSRLKAEQTSRWPIAEARDGNQIDLSRIPGPDAVASDMVFLSEMNEGWFAVANTARKIGFAMRYPVDVFKRLWYWQVYRGGRDYPWWSATYNIALEPCSSLPVLSKAVERGEALRLGAGESRAVEMMAIAFEGLDKVGRVNAEGVVMRDP
ncbi:MAG TPA: hypothetical protein VNS63_08545, partial [Blastocatellia bacterium]|nr:hypothetical protein [Blastocatellia bacterium]